MLFRIHILGCGSATPTLRHAPTSQVVEHETGTFLIDCGEGTQVQLRKNKLGFQHLQNVFISHLHGDHCLGLIPMLSSFSLLGRIKPLHLFAPAEYEQLFHAEMACYCPYSDYEIAFHGIDTTKEAILFENSCLEVSTIPMDHRVPCCGFLFREKPLIPHIRRDMIDALHIPVSQIMNIKKGADWTDAEGNHYTHEQLTKPAHPPRAYAFCSDTRYMPTLHTIIKDVDLLYHEATYAEDNLTNAEKYFHSTARQAAHVAKDAGVGKLLIGHFSARYPNEKILLNEAQEVFANTLLANEGMIVDV